MLFNEHGNQHSLAALSTSTRALAEEWIAGGNDNLDIRATPQRSGEFHVQVGERWTARNFTSFFNNQDSIILLAACQTGSSFAAHIGGRAVFGYTTDALIRLLPTDAALLFNRMNGTLPAGTQGTLRRAGDAIGAGGFVGALRFGGNLVMTANSNPLTTLCPSVDHPTSSSVFPKEGTPVPLTGNGFVIFDTNLSETNIPANQVVVKDSDISGTTTISGQTWVNPHQINFAWNSVPDYGGYPGGNPSARLKVVGAKAIAVLGKQQLDGGSFTTNGVAPNATDFVWTMTTTGH